jgi:hypothetical protein
MSLDRFNLTDGVPHFFRLAVSPKLPGCYMPRAMLMQKYVANGTSLDYIKPATWWPNGSWTG